MCVCVCVCVLSLFICVRLFAMLWTAARQAPLSLRFSRQEYWSGLPCLPPRDLPNPGIEPRSPALQADSSPSEPPGKPKNTGVCSLSLLQGALPDPGIKPGSPALQVNSLPAEPTGKPKNTGLGSLSLLKRIFLTQESNQGLLPCKQSLCQLSYVVRQGSYLPWE